jgi:hypothetical protein
LTDSWPTLFVGQLGASITLGNAMVLSLVVEIKRSSEGRRDRVLPLPAAFRRRTSTTQTLAITDE